MSSSYDVISSLLGRAGIHINGDKPYDITVHNEQFYQRILREGSLGVGESYIDGWWDCQALDEFVSKVLQANLDREFLKSPGYILAALKFRLFNLQSLKRAYQVADTHYNLGNDLFQAMLDKRLCYSCGYWKSANDLEQAQRNKLDLLCRKLDLQPGDKVLDIGCGWGSFLRYAARHYGVEVTGITVSSEQQALAQQRCEGLPVTVLLEDYRHLNGKFDKIVSIGMFEHVGHKNYRTYFSKASELLNSGGLFALHTIGLDRKTLATDPWIERYIFPNGKIPALSEISAAAEPDFVIDDVQNFGPDYDTTLMSWHARFRQAWPALSEHYDQRFYRMWEYYLLACAGSFRSSQLQLFQCVMRHRNEERCRYDSPR